MRHRTRTKRLSRNTSARKALLRSLARNLITHQRIKTSLVKAKEARKLVEKLITLGKENTLDARRRAYRILNERDKVKQLFADIAPLFKNRAGGYTRIIRTYPRRGDGAEMALLELTEQPVREKEIKKTKKGKIEEKKGKVEGKKEDPGTVKKEPEAKVAPPPAHEKKTKEPRKEEKSAKKSQKKGFFKNLRQYFNRKSID